jgi:choline dehydrogenase-like flavoprotein
MTASVESNMERPTDDMVDVLIIGAGASGAVMAASLAETRMKILCLEQGDWIKSSEFPANGRDWEARRYADFDFSPNRRMRDTDYPVNDDNSIMKVANFNGVGGGTILFTAHYPRMHPSDFRVRTLDGVAEDWPIDYWTLEPYFAENDRITGVAGLAGDPAYPLHQPTMPPVPLGKSGTRYAKAMNELGWHWWPSDISVATTEYNGRAKCINLGHCTPGCAQGAKASVDITYWPQAIRDRVELRTRCRVREITTNEHGMASGVVYYDPKGVERFQPAEMVILAANGVGTPRLLLNSTSARFPDGLANSSGLVGKNLMLHPWPQIAGYVEDELDGDRGPMTVMWSKQFYETDPSRDFVRGYTLQFNRGTGPVNEAITSMIAGRLPWGRDHHRRYRELVYRRLQIGVACEDLPEEHNRVTLDPVLKDGHGIPAPKIDYTMSENTTRMMEHGIARASEILGTAGAKYIGCSRTLLNSPGHLLGTARMGLDPACSVVNEWGALPRREEPLHRRWQHLGHLRRRQSDVHHSGAGALHRR